MTGKAGQKVVKASRANKGLTIAVVIPRLLADLHQINSGDFCEWGETEISGVKVLTLKKVEENPGSPV